jgi:hypothetical protein
LGWAPKAVLVGVLASASVSAAPPDGEDPGQGDSIADPAITAQVEALANQGSAKFEVADYPAAIALWEQAYELLPATLAYAPMRLQLQVLLAYAHVQAYAVDADAQHLHKADLLFVAYLEGLDPADTVSRAQIEGEREKLATEIARLEAEQSERERAKALELAAREAEVREQSLDELELVETPPWTEQDRRRTKLYTIGGASMLGLGGGGLGLMVAGLVGGAATEREGRDSIEALPGDASDYSAQMWSEQVRRGTVYNTVAWVSGSIAGGLLIAGTTLITTAALQRRRAGVKRPKVMLGGLRF